MVETGEKKDVWNRDVTNYIALTDFAKAKFVQGGFPGQKIVIKQNVVFPQRTELIRADKNPDQAIFVGRFSTEKGISVLLKASDGIRGSIVLCGTGPCLEKVLKAARNNVSVKGHIPKNELYALIHESLFLVVPSIWYEGYPMAILEAFSQGVPCVASNIGGIPEIVEDGKTGLLFEPGNADDLRDKMNMLFGNKRLCEQLGRNARETYLTKHSPESNYLRLRSIYENAIASKKSDAAIG
jgi:glycosyltransferase involved in cell wall biosynthesis